MAHHPVRAGADDDRLVPVPAGAGATTGPSAAAPRGGRMAAARADEGGLLHHARGRRLGGHPDPRRHRCAGEASARRPPRGPVLARPEHATGVRYRPGGGTGRPRPSGAGHGPHPRDDRRGIPGPPGGPHPGRDREGDAAGPGRRTGGRRPVRARPAGDAPARRRPGRGPPSAATRPRRVRGPERRRHVRPLHRRRHGRPGHARRPAHPRGRRPGRSGRCGRERDHGPSAAHPEVSFID